MVAPDCFNLYKDILPEDAQISEVESAGRELTVHYTHSGGSGEIQCLTLEDGSLDGVETLNLKIDLLWDHPEIKVRLP